MRIDSGKFKGRRLADSKYSHIRPTTDKVRQALFVKLQFFLPGKSVLDLCCGTGALGIEAFSRGAENVVMVDKDFRSVSLAKSNLKSLGVDLKSDNISVVKCDAVIYLQKCEKTFDLILFDPPYKSGLYEKVLQVICVKNLLTEDGILVCEHSNDDKFDYTNFQVLDEKRYGDTVLTYLTLKK